MEIFRTPDERFEGLPGYDFEPNYTEVDGLRLHYVEFFGKFYSPGGQQYHPLGHWRPSQSEQSLSAKGTP